MRYSIGFLNGFLTGKGSLPLASDGDETVLTLTKGDDFQAWLRTRRGLCCLMGRLVRFRRG